MAHEQEHDYLIQAQAGDPEAFDLLHLSLEPALLRFVRRLVGDDHLAEDIVQETFITLYTHLEDIYPPEKLRPFMFRVARNKAYDVLRRGGRYDVVSLDDEPLQMRISFHADKSQPPDEIAHWMLLYLEVQEAIDRLPEHHRQTLILYCEEDLSYAEIAEVMNVNIGTVKSRLFHAKKTMRGLVSPQTLLAIQQPDAPDVTDTDEAPVVKNKLSIEESIEEESHGREPKDTITPTIACA